MKRFIIWMLLLISLCTSCEISPIVEENLGSPQYSNSNSSSSSTTHTESHSGRIYVNGYHRKDGTYVHGYWRNK